MSQHDNLAIHEDDAQRINGVLLHFLGESGAMEALLIDRSGQLLARGASHAEIVEEAYLASLSRYPTDDERAAVLEVLDAAPAEERRLVVEDLFWSLLSGKEFLFNH